MKVKISRTEIQKTVIENEIELPENSLYIFEYGYRLSHAILPQITTWNIENDNGPETMYAYIVITVDISMGACSIKKTEISVHHILMLYNSTKDTIESRICQILIDGVPDNSIRTEEQFIEDYNKAITAINSILDITTLH